MVKVIPQIYLASKSPRRRKLLTQIGIKFKSFSVDLNEEIFDGEHPIKTVKRLALHKSDAACKKVKAGIIITADTIVVLNKKIIGKPKNVKDAFHILSKLSGKTHAVYTGFAICNVNTGKRIVDYEKTRVTFRKLLPEEIRDYIKTGSPMDKAGAYGIQDDFGAVFIEKINGCYYNVVGLPLAKFYKRLMEFIQID
jgi:septum formation protein